MPLFYGHPSAQRFYGFLPYDEQDATKHYLKHYRNYLLLDFMSKNSESYNDRQQAIKELEHCERVMYRWKLHPNWDPEIVLPALEIMKKKPISELVAELLTEGE